MKNWLIKKLGCVPAEEAAALRDLVEEQRKYIEQLEIHKELIDEKIQLLDEKISQLEG